MTPTTKILILRALEQHRGDNYERATARFRRYSYEEMHSPYGDSGPTPNEILAAYKSHVNAVDKAIAEVNAL
jgi:hypothetical protein